MTTDALYIDLLITDRDFTLNSGNEPVMCNNRASIGQDIVHAIIESGLATRLVAERSPVMRADIITQLVLLAEEDERVIPGTVQITEESLTKLWVTAETYDFGSISLEASV